MLKTILLVDDDPNIRDTAADILEDAGFRILLASTAAEAMDKINQESVHLVISDLQLPDMPGEELSRRIRASFPAIKIIVMSGQEDLAQNPIRHLVDAVLLKPVAPPDLVAIIEKTLKK